MVRVEQMIRWLGWRALSVLFLLLFAVVFYRNAWVVDDAYITFRTVDNFINGHGLTWNVAERVLVYTHPLWMFVVSFFYWLSGDIFYTAIGVSAGACLAAVGAVWIQLRGRQQWRLPLLLLMMMASKAVMDYTSSGLENPLSYMLAALFFAEYMLKPTAPGVPSGRRSERSIFFLFFVASLAFFNRVDTLIVYLPALLHVLVANFSRLRLRLVPLVLLATLPASLWELFSLFYYGFPFPNTAYAKVLTTGFTFDEKWSRGVQYLKASISCDALAYIVLIFAGVLAARRKSVPALACLCGVLAYGGYVVAAAASATHMAGRFFALPLFVAIVAFVHLLESKKDLAFFAVLTVFFVVWNPMAPTKMGTKKYKTKRPSSSCVDTNWHVHMEGMALKPFKKHRTLPHHDWLVDGKILAKRADVKIHMGGAKGGEAIGYFGFGAGPNKVIVDYVGLGDPLLARLPPVYTHVEKSGHHYRYVPRGYIRSLRLERNEIADPNLRTFYARLASITRGDLFSLKRLARVININTGGYDELVKRYLAGKEYRGMVKRCAALKKKDWPHFVEECLEIKSRFIE